MNGLLRRILVAGVLLLSLLSAAEVNAASSSKEVDSLMRVLDGVIGNRNLYREAREKRIAEIKLERSRMRSDREVYEKNKSLIEAYESFVCDSAKAYIRENLVIARRLHDTVLISECAIRLALVYSMSGQFVQADKLFSLVDYNGLPDYLKALYGWARVKYLGNMAISTDEPYLQDEYIAERHQWRDSLVGLFSVDSDFYRKEVAARYQEMGNYTAAIPIYLDVFNKVEPDTHEYAMMAKGMADIFHRIGNEAEKKRYLLLSAIADTRLAVKENESLLSLAEMLYAEDDIERAYRYMQAALDDANFYNSRFKNSQIARVYPVVEKTYLDQLQEQQHRMRIYIGCMAVLALVLGLVALFSYRQTRIISRSKAELKKANERLERASHKLTEANIIRERYVGYFMHQCSLNVNRLDEFRKNVNRKLKVNQVNEVYTMSARPLEKELEELYVNFDKAFLNLYPNFIEEFNELLKPEGRFAVTKDRLNITLRIFALIRLGITDMTQIANFLHYSVQTIYNYKSRVRKVSLLAPEAFEEKVKKIGTLAAVAD